MIPFKACAAPLLAFQLLACSPNQSAPERNDTTSVANASLDENAGIEAAASPKPELDAVNVVDNGAPDLTAPALTLEAERGEKGARNVLLSFGRAIELKEYGQAWAMLSPADRQKWHREAFAAIFADLAKVTVVIPDGIIEGAAGSSYYTVPIAVTGNDEGGRPVRLEGNAVLRRVNDVDGATPAQRRWHFESFTLDATH